MRGEYSDPVTTRTWLPEVPEGRNRATGKVACAFPFPIASVICVI
jgi:hypothetical protein